MKLWNKTKKKEVVKVKRGFCAKYDKSAVRILQKLQNVDEQKFIPAFAQTGIRNTNSSIEIGIASGCPGCRG